MKLAGDSAFLSMAERAELQGKFLNACFKLKRKMKKNLCSEVLPLCPPAATRREFIDASNRFAPMTKAREYCELLVPVQFGPVKPWIGNYLAAREVWAERFNILAPWVLTAIDYRLLNWGIWGDDDRIKLMIPVSGPSSGLLGQFTFDYTHIGWDAAANGPGPERSPQDPIRSQIC
jgi:hypothetical protein